MQRDQSVTLGEMRVIFEFEDFFQDIPGLPLRREVDFCIELQHGTVSISWAPYRMALAEFRELLAQLEELQAQVLFILVIRLGEHQFFL